MKKSAIFAATAMSFALVACDSSGVDVGDDIEDDVEVAEIKFHPEKQFCVEYSHEGTLSGTSKNCSRNWGAESVTIENMKIGIGGFSQEQNSHKITIGDTIYVIDPAKMTGTKTKNPIYKDLSKTDPIQLGKAMMEQLQMNDTGEDKDIAGISCNVLKSDALGGGGCFTDNMVMLELDMMGAKQVATKVDLNSGGDDADYRLYEKAEITDGPDVGAIMDQL